MIQSEKLKEHAKRLRLYNIANRMDSILHHAQEEKPTYPEFLSLVLGTEVEMKERKDYERRLVAARLPRKHDLDEYDYNFYEGIDRRQMKELRELVWLREAYNLILMGPSGTGKTFLAAGLVFDAVKAGYKAYLMTMEDIVNCLRLKDISTPAMMTYNKILRAQLLAIDDIMLFPVKREEATAFFNLINTLHEKTSIIITTNKAPTEWVETLNDEILASALLDRLLYRCEVIKFTGSSYRLENRQTIFKTTRNEKRTYEALVTGVFCGIFNFSKKRHKKICKLHRFHPLHHPYKRTRPCLHPPGCAESARPGTVPHRNRVLHPPALRTL